MAKLLKLHLENYRNIKNADFNFDGKDGKIIGANRIGKTNVLESICFLLTDKLLGGSADVPAIKNHEDPRARVVVEGTFLTSEGDVTLRKEFYEKWVHPRGSATEELAGHCTDYFINGAEQSRAKDFFEKLTAKFGIPTDFNGMDAYQLVIDPFYLPTTICGSKDWKNAREAVIEIVGDVKPEEIYAKDENARIAKTDLEAHQYDEAEAKKAIRGEIDGYKDKMTQNEGLLIEYGKAEDIPEEDYQRAKTEDDSLSDQIAKLKAGTANPYSDEIAKLSSELYELQQKYQKAATAGVDRSKSLAISKEINDKQNALFALQREHQSCSYKIKDAKNDLDLRKVTQDTIKKRLTELNDEFKSIIVEDTCHTCGQKLPADKIQEAFNKKQAELKAKAQDVHDQGVDNKKGIVEDESLIAALSQRDFDQEETIIKVDINALDGKFKQVSAEETASIKQPDPAIQKRLAEINARLSEIHDLQNKGAEGVNEQIQGLRAKKEELQATFSRRISFANAQKRLAEIKTENVTLGKKRADGEQRLWAVGEFIKAKLNLLDEHMASKLGEIRFQLIKPNIKSGSYDEVCVPYIVSPATEKSTSTLFDSGSKSEQIYTGCQIIKAIRSAKNWEPLPVLFDQGGELDETSVQKVSYDSEAQIIAVKVEGMNSKPTFVPFEN